MDARRTIAAAAQPYIRGLPTGPAPVDGPLGLYVHIPFCETKCGYCDFNTYAAIEPLMKIVANTDMNPTMRESAAAALGILCDPRETDPMFEIDASVNPYGLTSATRELVRIY